MNFRDAGVRFPQRTLEYIVRRREQGDREVSTQNPCPEVLRKPHGNEEVSLRVCSQERVEVIRNQEALTTQIFFLS